MKKRWLALLGAVLLIGDGAVLVNGCGSSASSTPTKVGEVEQATATEQEVETDDVSTPETKSEYHVGDILKDGDMQIVYVSSGEYTEDNEFMQPQEGNKYIFIKLAFENQGSSDTSVSFFSFECYADGYSADAHYTDDDLSATLSAGRTTEGVLVYEVPQDAQEIEIEYETNFITEEKIKFVYDGDTDSGYVNEGNAQASENAYAVGDIVESDNLNISYLSCETDTTYNEFMAPEAGYHYVTLTFEFENKGNSDEFVSFYDFDCYADGKNCDQTYYRDDSLSATISAGRKAQGTVTFVVPDDAATVEAEFVSNVWTSSRVVFTVSE